MHTKARMFATGIVLNKRQNHCGTSLLSIDARTGKLIQTENTLEVNRRLRTIKLVFNMSGVLDLG